ncbi:MAG: dTMP kinase [candidate division Zixibacteria bacterium]|nr:dTMP kinase [candidate division Zixibacteria bacterium]
MTKRHGIFITFEGIDGCGKSTQADRLVKRLRRLGHKPLFVREPGGTAVSEKIRRILLDRRLQITPLAELLLYEAARAHLVQTVISPALTSGRIVVCDRFFDSTTAYQGYGRRLDLHLIDTLNRAAADGVAPDLTFILDVDYRTSLTRRGKIPDRLENENRAFFNRVRRGFLSLAEHKRVVLLKGREDIDTMAGDVWTAVEPLIRKTGTRRAR